MPAGRWQSVTMVLRSEPSGFIESMRSPLNSSRNNRPERVAPDEAFDLVASTTLIVCPSVLQLRFDSVPLAGELQVQRVSHFLLLRLQIAQRVHRRTDLAGKPRDHLDACVAERARLARIIGQQANAFNAMVVEDRRRDAEVSEISLEPERMIGLDRVDSRVLQLVSLQLSHQADAAPLLVLIDEQSTAFLRDRLHGELQLAAAVAAQRAKHLAGEALRVDAH